LTTIQNKNNPILFHFWEKELKKYASMRRWKIKFWKYLQKVTSQTSNSVLQTAWKFLDPHLISGPFIIPVFTIRACAPCIMWPYVPLWVGQSRSWPPQRGGGWQGHSPGARRLVGPGLIGKKKLVIYELLAKMSNNWNCDLYKLFFSLYNWNNWSAIPIYMKPKNYRYAR